MVATISDAYRLFHEGAIALARVEQAGIRVDTAYLDKQIDAMGKKISALEGKLRKSDIYAVWLKEFGDKAKLGSGTQLGKVLFDILKVPYVANRTATGRYRTDRAVLETIDHPFVHDYLKMEDMKKDKSTFLEGIRAETVDGFLHCFFHLASGDDEKGGARSYRSSSSSINFQNFPNRDPARAAVIRKAFIPRGKDYQIGEIDFKAAEVCLSACYHKDPTMIDYILNPKKDMHRDMARELFFIGEEQNVPKPVRNTAKAAFVFAQFYGDYYVNCTANIWGHIEKDRLKLADETPLKKHLRRNGIKERGLCDGEQTPAPGTFESHVKGVERDFWYRRFPVYTQWKKDWYNQYLEDGYINYLTGFRIEGVYTKNQILNYPIQGASFHCLLWTLTKLQKWLRKNKMLTKIIGQIHDSIVLDIYRKELQDVLNKIKELVTRTLPRVWKWLIVPLTVEVEISPVGMSWYDKKPWVERDGMWQPENN